MHTRFYYFTNWLWVGTMDEIVATLCYSHLDKIHMMIWYVQLSPSRLQTPVKNTWLNDLYCNNEKYNFAYNYVHIDFSVFHLKKNISSIELNGPVPML